MNDAILREHYQNRGQDGASADSAVAAVAELETWLLSRGVFLEAVCAGIIRVYLDQLINDNRNTPETLLALERYFYLINNHGAYLYMARLLGGIGVFGSIADRLSKLEGSAFANSALSGIQQPAAGQEPAAFPVMTEALVNRLKQRLPEPTVQRVLAGNHHQIPASAFEQEKRFYQAASSLDDYLRKKHTRKVAELQHHCDTGTVWFEQEITQPVVDYVAANQEILSAVRDGDTLYHTKIPYDPARYLKESSPERKRYYACHCPLVREAILQGQTNVSPTWCYCSGGFAKYPYEVLFGRELRVTLLQSVLKGDAVCRFAIHLDDAPEERTDRNVQ
ncbi:MAG: DUF6144 family protein [Eubacteriales bacterium]|nr:DUF6144 family protein [Eubacteriales bacterium]